jgi:hypothetical protein
VRHDVSCIVPIAHGDPTPAVLTSRGIRRSHRNQCARDRETYSTCRFRVLMDSVRHDATSETGLLNLNAIWTASSRVLTGRRFFS